MNILVTAGNTQVLLDQVRCITNIFTGRTGAGIALHAHERGHTVTLLTSHPEVVADLAISPLPLTQRWRVVTYRTFDDLHERMEQTIRQGGLDGVIHCAAVSDYRSGGIYAPGPATHFRVEDGRWLSENGEPILVDRAAGKVKSDEPELWLRLIRTPKLVDRIRTDWGFQGLLVKFKLEVGLTEEQLRAVAERSRRQSAADLLVANTLEGATAWALLGPIDGRYQRIDRPQLATRLLQEVEHRYEERRHA